MKKMKVWIDPDWSPGGIDWDLQSKGMAKIYATQGMDTWISATLIIDRSPQAKKAKRARKKPVDK